MSVIKKLSVAGASLAVMFVALFLLAGLPSQTASAASAKTAKQITAEMGAGWNLGNTLDATGGSGLSSETSWGNPKTTKAMIDAVKKEGFNTVRIPVSWGKHTSGSDFKINSDWMARVKQVVDYCIDNDMYVILNIHHDTDKKYYYPSSAYKTQSLNFIRSIWKQISTEFKNYDQHLIFETMNEPRLVGTGDEWWFPVNNPNSNVKDSINIINQLNQAAVDVIRASGGNNAQRCIMVPGYGASIDGCATSGFKLPNDTVSDRLIVSVHAYTPYNFCLNGSGTSVFSSSLKSEVDQLFNTLNTKYLSKNIPVVIGETSASNKGNKAERLKWAEYFCGKASKLGVPCVLWDNNAYNNSDKGEAHGHLNRSTLSWYDKSFVDKIVSYYPVISYDDVSYATVASISDKTYTGSAIKPAVTVKLGGKTLKSGTDYTVKYSANVNVGTAKIVITGKGAYKGSKTVTFKIVPKAVTGLKTTGRSASSLKISWTKAASVNGYTVQIYKGGKWTTAATLKSASTVTCTVNGLSAGTGYQLRVQAYKTVSGKNYYSAAKTITAYTSPAAISSFTLASRGDKSLKLSWKKVASAGGYLLEQYKSGKWATVANIKKNSTVSYTVSGLKQATQYKFRIRAYKSTSDGTLYSAVKSLTGYTAPSKVSGFKLAARGAGSLKFSWSKNSSANGYLIERAKGGKWTTVANISKNSTVSYTVKGLSPVTSEKFRIRAYKTVGNTKIYSAVVSGTYVTAPTNVSGFKAASVGKNTISLKWQKNKYAGGYRIEYYSAGKWVKLCDRSASATSVSLKNMTSKHLYKFRIRTYKKVGGTYYFSSGTTLNVTTK